MNHAPPGPILAADWERIDVSVSEGGIAQGISLIVGNQGTGTMQYSVVPSVSWIAVTPTNGTIIEGSQPNEHTITINGGSLLAGRHEANITFTTIGDVQTRQTVVIPVSLDVAPPKIWMDEAPLTGGDGSILSVRLHRNGVISSPLAVQLTVGGLISIDDFHNFPRVVRFSAGASDMTAYAIIAPATLGEDEEDGYIGIVPSPNYTVLGNGAVAVSIQPPPTKTCDTADAWRNHIKLGSSRLCPRNVEYGTKWLLDASRGHQSYVHHASGDEQEWVFQIETLTYHTGSGPWPVPASLLR